MFGIPKRIEVLAIGDELLDGRVADTNTLRLAHALQGVGLEIAQRTTVRDQKTAIIDAAQGIVSRGTELCVVSGGLGPTADDITTECLAQFAGVGLVRDQNHVQALQERMARRGRQLTDNQLKQADRPAGAEIVPNALGTAPGFALKVAACTFVSLPGVPREFDAMVADVLVQTLQDAGCVPMPKRVLTCFGIIEAEVDQQLQPMAQLFPNIRVGFRAHFPEIHVSLALPPGTKAAVSELDNAEQYVAAALGDQVFGRGDKSFAEAVVGQLHNAKATVSLAESCTGGLLASMLTDVPGVSDVFAHGVVAYSNAAKVALLNVSEQTLAQFGAVSEQTVMEMATGVRAQGGSTFGVAVSGIAGPAGGSDEKPVGTIWFALAGPLGTVTQMLSLPFGRRGNKSVSAYHALLMLRRAAGQL